MHDTTSATIGRVLNKTYPDAHCELLARDPWELLVAAILSARTSDIQVNKVMAVLTEHYLGPASIADLDHRDLARVIRHVPLYRQKARAIVEAARTIVRLYDGKVPQEQRILSTLPGVGRKTAAVVVGNAYDVPAIAADTHVQRIVYRLGWNKREHPLEAEAALVERFPPQHWVKLCHQLIRLGREHCRRQKPRCQRCPIAQWCQQQGVAG